MALSGQASWIIQNKEFQNAISRFPLADQTLDLFLKNAKISPAQETGRISFYLLEIPKAITALKEKGGDPVSEKKGKREIPINLVDEFSGFLLQLGGFRDPRSLVAAVAETFPEEGSLRIRDTDCPLHVVLDINQIHVRMTIDTEDNIWIGDLKALGTLASRGTLPSKHPITTACEWIDGKAPAQGFMQTQPMLKELAGNVSAEMASEIPLGVEALAWSLAPGSGPKPLHQMELALTGSREGINQVTPWMYRLVGAVTALQEGSAQPPEILKEPNRVGLRARFTEAQVNAIMTKLNQPGNLFGTAKPTKKP